MASKKIQLNHGWTFEYENRTLSVVLPHNAVDLPYDYPDETSYQREFSYRRQLDFSADMNGKEVFCSSMALWQIQGFTLMAK